MSGLVVGFSSNSRMTFISRGKAVANTGIAGPASEDGIPVGTLCFAWAFEHHGNTVVFSETRHFDGDRNAIRKAGADYAIQRIVFYHRQLLEGSPPRLA